MLLFLVGKVSKLCSLSLNLAPKWTHNVLNVVFCQPKLFKTQQSLNRRPNWTCSTLAVKYGINIFITGAITPQSEICLVTSCLSTSHYCLILLENTLFSNLHDMRLISDLDFFS